MTEQENVNTEEAEIESTDAEESSTESYEDDGDELGQLVRQNAEKLSQAAKIETEEEDGEPEGEEEDEESADDDDDDQEPVKKADDAPKGRRARQEYEKRRQIEGELDQFKAQMQEMKAQTEAYKNLFEAMTKGKDETPAVEEDMDAYLVKAGFDPENFVDEEAKKAVYLQTKKIESLEKGTAEAGKKQEDVAFQSAYNARYQGLPEADKNLYNDAVVHVLKSEIQELKFANPEVDDKVLIEYAQKNMQEALQSVFTKGQDPVAWLYGYATSAKGFTPKSTTAKAEPKTDMNKLDKLRKSAGAPSIDVADTGGLGQKSGVKMTPKMKAAFDDLQKYAI